MDNKEFINWETFTRDTIDLKKIYIDIAGDIVSGVLLSQIIFWNLPNIETGRTKLRVSQEGRLWLVKGREDWYDECRITPKQFDVSIKKLRELGIVSTIIKKYAGTPKLHIYLHIDTLMNKINEYISNGQAEQVNITDIKSKMGNSTLPKEEIGHSQIGNIDIPKLGTSFTEITNRDQNTENQNQSVNSSVTKIIDPPQETDQLTDIFDNCQLELFEPKIKMMITNAITQLQEDNNIALTLRMGLTHQQILHRLQQLQLENIDYAIAKTRSAKAQINPIRYFQKCLITSVVDIGKNVFEDHDLLDCANL